MATTDDEIIIIDIDGVCAQEKEDANECIQTTSEDLCSSCYGDTIPNFNDFYAQDLESQFLRTQSFMVDIHDPDFCSVANERMCEYFTQHNSCCCAPVVQTYRKCLFDKVLIPNLTKNEAGYGVTCKDTCDYNPPKSVANDQEGNQGNDDGKIMALVGGVFAALVIITVAIGICWYKNQVKKNTSIGDEKGAAAVTSDSGRTTATQETVDIEQHPHHHHGHPHHGGGTRATTTGSRSSSASGGGVGSTRPVVYQQPPQKPENNGARNVSSNNNTGHQHHQHHKNNNVDVESGVVVGSVVGNNKNNPILHSSSNALMNEMDDVEEEDLTEIVEESIRGCYDDDDDDEALFMETNAIINQANVSKGDDSKKPKRPEQRGAYETAATKEELEVSAAKLENLRKKKQKIHEWRAARRRGSNESLEEYLSEDDDDMDKDRRNDQEIRQHSYDIN